MKDTYQFMNRYETYLSDPYIQDINVLIIDLYNQGKLITYLDKDGNFTIDYEYNDYLKCRIMELEKTIQAYTNNYYSDLFGGNFIIKSDL